MSTRRNIASSRCLSTGLSALLLRAIGSTFIPREYCESVGSQSVQSVQDGGSGRVGEENQGDHEIMMDNARELSMRTIDQAAPSARTTLHLKNSGTHQCQVCMLHDEIPLGRATYIRKNNADQALDGRTGYQVLYELKPAARIRRAACHRQTGPSKMWLGFVCLFVPQLLVQRPSDLTDYPLLLSKPWPLPGDDRNDDDPQATRRGGSQSNTQQFFIFDLTPTTLTHTTNDDDDDDRHCHDHPS